MDSKDQARWAPEDSGTQGRQIYRLRLRSGLSFKEIAGTVSNTYHCVVNKEDIQNKEI